MKETKNFRNIAKSIAMRHQRHMAFQFSYSRLFATEVTDFVYSQKIVDIPDHICTHIRQMGADMGQKATVLGTVYECGQAVMVEHPAFYFGEVIAVCKCGSRVFVVLLFLNSVFYKHINASEVWASTEWAVMPVSALACHKPCVVHVLGDKRFVVLKYSME